MGNESNSETIRINNENYNRKFINSLLKGVRTIFLLWLIGQKPIHGYAIISTINEIMATSYENKEINSKEVVHGSTIYPLLHKLEDDDLICSCEEYNGNHKIKLYSITEKGINSLNSIKHCLNNQTDNMLVDFINELVFDKSDFSYMEVKNE